MNTASNCMRDALRPLSRTGVIYVTTGAEKLGFHPGDAAWSNLGQGTPEAGPLPDAPPRISAIEITDVDHEYGPII